MGIIAFFGGVCKGEGGRLQNYTHSLLDMFLPLCYNDDNINERSELK